MKIKMVAKEIRDGIHHFCGFETSFDFMQAVANGYYQVDNRCVGGKLGMMEVKVGEYLFDYETGTMWEVIEK